MSPESPNGPRKRVTSADVARESGVSRATVSYVLNNVPGRTISARTRQVVLETAHRLGHVPYAPARSLRLGRSNIVLALVQDFALGFISSRALRRLDTALAARGYVVLAHRYDESLRSLSELWGLVSPTVVVAMGGLSVPEQSAIQDSAKLLRVHGIVPHEKAGRMQAEYLYSKGHRILGYALPADPSLALVASERLAGVRGACERLGIDQPIVRVVDTDDPTTVFAALDDWILASNGVTAVCAHNDEIAMMLCSGMTSRGIVPGKDLAIIGVDNIPTARISLTTVEIDADAWADAVIESVLNLIDDKPALKIEGDFLNLIIRETA
ncbi:MAG TPA: LacI family DNA-binding transcriptional regulator [Terrimesophilobacter sp.]|jgi:Transcriptional regulators|uniref:LacI family DNA-binding transcriptional regulator n=1 Tax=Terrimesophilobacter sp. TaxID=2906435 RepID=UPI002F923303